MASKTDAPDLDFVERPSHDFFCPVSLQIMLEPQQTSCCGNHLSQEVATRLQREGKPCPMCNSEKWSSILDKYHRRKVHEVRVRCWNRGNGCKWVGEFNGLEKHIPLCKNRSWKCKYCGLTCEFVKGKGKDKHWSTCSKFPEPCPNHCKIGIVKRCNMEQHRSVCLLEPVPCEMKEFGCSVVVPRKELATHMKESELQHMTAMTMLNLRLTKQLQQDSTERDKKITQLQKDSAERDRKIACLQQDSAEKERKIRELQQEVTAHKEQCAQTQSEEPASIRLSDGWCEMMVQNYTDLKHCPTFCYKMSDPFYTHHCGYKFKLKIMFYDDDIGASLYLMKGEYDRQLCWPVTVNVRLELLNQIGNHHDVVKTKTITWLRTEKERDFEIECNMIKYQTLEKNVRGIRYVVNNSLKFKVLVNVV